VVPVNEFNKIESVIYGSIASEAGIAKGDILLKINDKEIHDILEYKYHCANTSISLEILKADGDIEIIEIEKDEYEDLGIVFLYPLMSKPKSCANRCIFCFIDQLPKGMRDTLYFKDDDSRLSFLQGNYVTLTNLSKREIKSIAQLKVSPINISVHATEQELRRMMMGNKNAGGVYEIMKYWAECGIIMNCQIVLCKNINDGVHLDKTIEDLTLLYPHVNSVSVVPVGLSDHREGLFELEPFNQQDTLRVIYQVQKWQSLMLERYGSRFVYIADEFYLKANLPIPSYEEYEDFPQIENGVGLIASMKDEFDNSLGDVKGLTIINKVSIATGSAAYEFISDISNRLMQAVYGLEISVYRIENTVFGKNVTVAGLICGQDIINQLKDKPLGKALYITSSMLRDGEEVFLDDYILKDLENILSTKIITVDNDGYDFISKLTKSSI